jgi:putative serine protease PepD
VQQAPAPQVPLQQTPVQQEPVHYTQPTTPLPEFAQAGAGGEFSPEAPKSKNGGGLVAGLLVGALVGALVGGGTAAVVAHNVGGQTVVEGAQGGSLTLNNLDSATAITGVAAVATPSVVTLQVFDGSVGGSGSGVIYSEDGYIITNAHVATLEGATSDPEITVQTSDGVLYDGTLVGSDPFADIAVVKIDAEGLTPVAIADSDKINVGDLAVVIGAPLNLSNTVTSGVVSALDRGISVASSMVGEDDGGSEQQEGPLPWFQFETPNEQQSSAPASRVAIPVIQTDASINPGNSGGALLNANAELIGINVALASPTASSGAAGSDGLGFAVPVNLAVRVADALIAGERPSHGLIGVTQTAESSTANRAGGVIGEVTPGSPADKGGLRAGDVITSINGRLADSFTTVTALVRMHEGGEEITIGYNRNGEQRETTVVLDTLEW